MTNNKISKLKNIIQLYTNTETMTNNKLAVDWLAKSYVDLLTKLNNEEISLKEFEIQYIKLLEQAKEMEKQQTRDDIKNELKLIGNYFDVGKLEQREQGHHIRFTSILKDRFDFYNETNGGNK
jgi:hypothetical protein